MRVLFFDTETSGFPEKGGKLVQLAATICDFSFDPPLVVQEFSSLVKCEEIPQVVIDIHGITPEMAAHGMEPTAICKWFKGAVSKVALIVAHNSSFDVKMMDFEFRRAEMGGFSPSAVFCTMMASTDLCELPGRFGKPKWPKLSEALPILCGIELDGAHDALVDTRGCKTLFIELVKRGLVPQLSNKPTPKPETQDNLI
tara:strand:- start:7309 stop:7905 length:597 start_codon:yes stop_codon:yes gene_type:complete